MKYYVFCIDSYAGGFCKVFDSEKEAREYIKSYPSDLNYIVKGEMIYED